MPDAVKNNAERLQSLLGYDPTKESPNQSIVQEAMKEIQDERNKKLKLKVVEQLTKASDLRVKMVKLKKDFESEYNKSDKELGKALNVIEAMATGKPLTQEGSDKDESAQTPTAEGTS